MHLVKQLKTHFLGLLEQALETSSTWGNSRVENKQDKTPDIKQNIDESSQEVLTPEQYKEEILNILDSKVLLKKESKDRIINKIDTFSVFDLKQIHDILNVIKQKQVDYLTNHPEEVIDIQMKSYFEMRDVNFKKEANEFESEYWINPEATLDLLLDKAIDWGIPVKTESVKERRELSDEVLKTMSNNEFLKISSEKRLQYVTKNHIDSSSVASWEVNDLEFTFIFDDVHNEALYKKTTAWQVLPDEVRSVVSKWVTYSRTWLKWEFFTESNKRLIIRERTKIEKIETWDISEIQEKNSKATSEYIKNNPESKHFSDIIEEAYDRDIDPEFAILAFSNKVKDLAVMDISRPVIIEEMFTEFDRKRVKIPMWNWKLLSNGKYPDEMAGRILKEFGGVDWRKNAILYWISEEKIKVVEKQIQASFESLDLSNLPSWVKWLLDVIASKESGWNYNAIYWNAWQSSKDYTSMSVNQVLSDQKTRISNWGQSATWRYQFIHKTLKWMVDRWVISWNEQFDEGFQDKIATIKLKERWLDAFMVWRISRDQFQVKLSQEWASLPKDGSNKSYYAGDGLNKSHISDMQIDMVLDGIKAWGYTNTETKAKAKSDSEVVSNNVWWTSDSNESGEEYVLNSITFYHNKIEESLDQLDSNKGDILKTGVVEINRWTDNLTKDEIAEITKYVEKKFWKNIKISFKLEKSYWGQIDS